MKFPTRPDNGGKDGRPMQISVNMFKFKGMPTGTIYQYDVVIVEHGVKVPDFPAHKQKGVVTKNPTPPPLNREILKALLAKELPTFAHVPIAYDGKSNLFLTQRLKLKGKDESELITGVEVFFEERQRTFDITFTFVAEIAMTDLASYLKGNIRTIPQITITAIDVILSHLPSYKFYTRGHSLYAPNQHAALGDSVRAHMGLYTSVRPCKGGLFLNIDLSCSAFYEPKPVINMVMDICKVNRPEDLARVNMSDRDRRKLSSQLRLVKVKTTHRSDFARQLRVSRVGDVSASKATFKDSDGAETNVAEYFQKQYSCNLKFPNLPVLVCGTKGAMFPLEVCEVVPGQYYNKKLSDTQTAEMIKVTCTRPGDRSRKITDGLKELGVAGAPQLNDLGLSLESQMLQLTARNLKQPELKYKNRSVTPQTGSWNLRDLVFSSGAKIPQWGVLVFASPRSADQRAVEKFITELVRMAGRVGMGVSNSQPPIVRVEGRQDASEAMMELNSRVKASGSDLKFVFCVLDTFDNKDAYRGIKRFCDSRVGIPSQCMLSKHLGRDRGPSPQYLGNILLKINAKLGGRNSDPMRSLAQTFPAPTIVMGADVTHPGAYGGDNARSIVAMVASQDPYMSRYSAIMGLQSSNKEDISQLKEMVKEQLLRFDRANNGLHPQKIVFFRDGVSEGQFEYVFDQEITAIRAACFELSASYKPAITFIVVQKRHHVRFFSNDRNNTDKSGNVLAGTVVDSDIVHPTDFDFYLMSHAGLQGTSRPAHYYVLLDENGFTSDGLQQFVYDMCYGSVRCTKAVSIPPAVYYAHLVAFRGRLLARSDVFGSDTESTISGGGATTSGEADLMLPHQNFDVNTPMFFV